MSTSAIIMMLIGCIGLWGGCAFSIVLAMRHSKKQNTQKQESLKK